MKTKIENLTLDLNRRLLFISDIHGNLDLLKKYNHNPNLVP